MTAPPRARELDLGLLAEFDDMALRVFLDPSDRGVDPADLGAALRAAPDDLVTRTRDALPLAAQGDFDTALRGRAGPADAARARRRVIDLLFWPLVYWNFPDDYDELIAGDQLHPLVLDELDLDGRVVCDIGAGSGRFTLAAAQRAQRVIAVDVVTPLLERLARRAQAAGIDNVEIRRGAFSALPVESASVDVAVACSSFTRRPPHGGDAALAEAERIVKPGGDVVVIWPHEDAWLRSRGFTYIALRGNDSVRFRDVATAARLCAAYYSATAARWVRAHGSATVPYRVLGVPPPNDLCVKRVPTPSRSPGTRGTRRTSAAFAPPAPGSR